MESNQVVLIGGTFNPFTNAHLAMAIEARKMFPHARIVFVPGNLEYNSKWKGINQDKAFFGDNRAELIAESIKGMSGCYVDDIEATGDLSGKTFDLVAEYSNFEEIYICVGADKLDEIGDWWSAEARAHFPY